MKTQIVVEHLTTGKVFKSKFEDLNEQQQNDVEDLLKSISQGAEYFEMEGENGSGETYYFSGNTLKECVITLIKS